ncbi:MAG: tRNA (adenosine(37)-N6)-dimethylallyltransferase MiaA [Gammaproteobacteria bacterium]
MTEDRAAPPLVFIMGPTGAGKTRLALSLAERLPCDIVSVDSALVYRGLDIGTAKPNPAERARAPHHLIDICDPTERYSAARFRTDARAALEAIAARGRLALLVGGTGLYFRALQYGLADLPDADPEVRALLRATLREEGAAELHRRLAEVDPEAAARIHPNDPQRLIRALEVHQLTGRPLSSLWRRGQLEPLAVPVLKLVLAPARRGVLHAHIARRFDAMLERGFVNEVRALRARGDLSHELPALRTVGYRELWRFLDGDGDYEAMRQRGIIATRQLAKRQLTWLRREAGCEWLDSADPAAAVQRAVELVQEVVSKACRTGLE